MVQKKLGLEQINHLYREEAELALKRADRCNVADQLSNYRKRGG